MSEIEQLRAIDAIEDPGERLIARLNHHRQTNVRSRKLAINRALLPDDVTDEEISIMAERITSGAQVPELWCAAISWI